MEQSKQIERTHKKQNNITFKTETEQNKTVLDVRKMVEFK